MSNETRRAMYDMDMSDIFAAAAKKAAYYRAATQERLNREYYNANIAWLIEIYKKERNDHKNDIYRKAIAYSYEVEKKFPRYFGTGYDNRRQSWVYKKIDYAKLAYPEEKPEVPPDYPKGEKTPDDLMDRKLEELSGEYRRGLEIIKSNLRSRSRHYAEVFNQKPAGERVYSTDEEEYKKNFKLGDLLITRKSGFYHITAGGTELPEDWEDIVWNEEGTIFGKKDGKTALINPNTGEVQSNFYEKLEIQYGLLVATTEGKKKCILNRTGGTEATRRYDVLIIFDGNNAQAAIFGTGEFFLEIDEDKITEIKNE